jgi:hypothetical protein
MPHCIKQFESLALLALESSIAREADHCAPMLLGLDNRIPRLVQQGEKFFAAWLRGRHHSTIAFR